ncbi:hypothetical protein [Nisaea sp.]|uniref:hypothetical protein n=1 Tax=Nisaea sp. TaxID=2024842 RepID=UPI0032EF8FC5
MAARNGYNPFFFVNNRWIGFLLILLVVVIFLAAIAGKWASPLIALLGGALGILREYFLAVQEDLRAKGALTDEVSKAGMIFVFGSTAFISLCVSLILGILRGSPAL